jgi:SAM-dependent methyltransferase
MKKPIDFYNEFDERLLKDYLVGNKRVINAITNLSRFIPKNSKQILDIGCGLGWSSFEFARTFENAKVHGIDLSPVLIDIAIKLFGDKENLNFKTTDITKELPKLKFDAIVLIDVYEHISIKKRTEFNKSVKKILKEQGRIILACPTKYHQNFLRNNKPEGLQPIDEDIDFNVISSLADDLSGEVIYFEYQSIWRTNDYLHAVVELDTKYSEDLRLYKNELKVEVEPKKKRVKRVEDKLSYTIDINKNKGSFLKKIKRKFRA